LRISSVLWPDERKRAYGERKITGGEKFTQVVDMVVAGQPSFDAVS
jgi:hypothetical protein